MRIGMLTDVYKPHVSGITHYISLNKRYLEKLGHQVFVFTFGGETYEDQEEGIIRSPGLPLSDTGYFISVRYPREARRYLYSMDVVHVHHPFLSGSLALRYCRPRGIPIVFTNHTRYDLYAQAYLPVIPDFLSTTAIQAFMPTFCRGCDLVIAPSKGMRDVLIKFGVDVPIEIVANGVDILPFKEHVEPVNRVQFSIEPEDVVLVYSGRLGPEKNLPFLLRSFSGLIQAYDHIHLVIIGDGPERENLIDRVHHMQMDNVVHFVGMVPYEKIPGYLAMADAFVTASVTEVHPLSVIEAMAAGLPVLGIRSPGIEDTIQDGVTGYLVQHEEIASFTAKLVRLATSKETIRNMGQNARLASEQFSIERTTSIMLDCYSKAIENAAARKRGLSARITRWLDRFRIKG